MEASTSGINASTSEMETPTNGIGKSISEMDIPSRGIDASTNEIGALISGTEASASSIHEEYDIIIKEEPEVSEEIEEPAPVESAPLELYVGRRVVAITYFLAQLKKISSHSPSCGFGDLKIGSEVKMGLMSMLTFKCSLCSQTFVVECDSDNSSIASKLLTLQMS
ncbi:uncharacterized protein LOC113227318 isoform X2 [Hyposmocoma kahamanoa]|uniref:uncharacterized protein LOC113227318 isoform X2 n=1 Tax=Hyposmocoma kahamanoa TaxID=1477025 RepID=UPI000E6D6630|nr:uncharacterized protein LOC113227318 isoform X2 [Hyposmocoma kahamanoa]